MACVTSWMSKNVTHPDVKAVVTTYALGRGQVSLNEQEIRLPLEAESIGHGRRGHSEGARDYSVD